MMGVEHVVVLSRLGVGKNPLLPHRRTKKDVARSAMAWTFLRASFFMQNLLEVHREDLIDHDRVFLPTGDGKTSFVDARDVGAVAARALQDSSLRYRAIDVTGADAHTYHEVAPTLSDVLDRDIEYANPGPFGFARTAFHHGTSLPFVLVQLVVYGTGRLGLAGRVTNDVERVLGRDLITLRECVEDYLNAFAPASDARTGT
jgi:uncharacterized protein YbjT (DUF2867 family)